MMMLLITNIKKITEDYKNNKIKYEEINERINEINKAIKIYKKK